MAKKIKPEQVKEILRSTGTKIGYCEFTKIDGSTRRIWFQKVTKRFVNGRGLNYDPDEKRMTAVRDMLLTDRPIRNIKWDAIIKLTVRGEHYELEKHAFKK